MASLVIPEKEWQLKSIARYIANAVTDYFRDPENRKKFEDWHREKYGYEYEWKKVKKQ